MGDRSQMGVARPTRLPRASRPDSGPILSLQPHRRRLRYEVIGLGLSTLGLALLLSAGRHTGVVAPVLNSVLAFLFGHSGAIVIAIALLGLGGAMILRWQPIAFGRVASGFGILMWIFLGISQLRAPGTGILGRDFATEPGGLFGLLLSEAMRPLFGVAFGIVILALAAFCTTGYITETPLSLLLQRTVRVAVRGVLLVAGVRLRRTKPPEPAQPRRPRPPVEPPKLLPPAPKPEPSREEPAPKPPEPCQPRLDVVDEPETEPEDAEPSPPQPGYEDFELPPLELLTEAPSTEHAQREALASVETLENALGSYGIDARVVDVERGPRVTRYEIHLPAGVRVSRVTNLADDLAYALSALAVRVEAPVPGKGVIGIEVPNTDVTFVHLREILESEAAQRAKSKVAFALGRDISGHPMMADLARMPHILIAGATNSGKSVCLNALITTILLRARPDEVKMLMIDPKRVELSLFAGIPHLAAPVAHDAKEAAGLLRWAIREMELRYSQFADLGVRNIVGWNERAKIDEEMEPFCYIVIVIDELADLMMQAATEFETSICRLAQLARATGIHLVVATQRPSVNVITGTIKANIASRIAFAVASQVDSRTILDVNGAERLVGSGDMLYLPLDAPTGKPVRIQGAYVSEHDIDAVVGFLKEQGKPTYSQSAIESAGAVTIAGKDEADDPMFETALEYVLATKHASASMLQRKFKLGYTRAARLIDIMEERGYVGPHDGRRAREVYASSADRVAELSRRPAVEDDEFETEEPDDEDSDVGQPEGMEDA
jgi:S-DNA-T family DNA segregation ATPase FtsK/SpoIIIE